MIKEDTLLSVEEERTSLSTRVVMSIVRQEGLSVNYDAKENSPAWRKQIGNIAKAIRATWGLAETDKQPEEDAKVAYRAVQHLLQA